MKHTGDRFTHHNVEVVFVRHDDNDRREHPVDCRQCPFERDVNNACARVDCYGGVLMRTQDYIIWRLTS